MKVSIITISYNSAETIQDTIESVLAQEYADIEYIIVDGASSDGTMEIINNYQNRVAQVISESDNGIYDAMNKGLKLATGELIGILNSDDVYKDSKVISDVVSTVQDSYSDALYADLVYSDRNDLTRVKRYWRSGQFRKNSFKWGWMPPHPTFFVKRSVYERYGYFNTSLKTSADYEIMLRFLFKEGISVCYLDRVITIMRMGGQSNASVKNRVDANKEDRMAWKLNGLKPNPVTFYLKPLRKVGQFIRKS